MQGSCFFLQESSKGSRRVPQGFYKGPLRLKQGVQGALKAVRLWRLAVFEDFLSSDRWELPLRALQNPVSSSMNKRG